MFHSKKKKQKKNVLPFSQITKVIYLPSIGSKTLRVYAFPVPDLPTKIVPGQPSKVLRIRWGWMPIAGQRHICFCPLVTEINMAFSVPDLGPVSQKSRNFSGAFRVT